MKQYVNIPSVQYIARRYWLSTDCNCEERWILLLSYRQQGAIDQGNKNRHLYKFRKLAPVTVVCLGNKAQCLISRMKNGVWNDTL